MSQYLGEYECKMDAKGRIRLPGQLVKQFGEAARLSFVVNRGFEHCLNLYTASDWEKISSKVSRLNQFNTKFRQFSRYFFRGATELQIDGSERILLPKQLIEKVGLDKDIVLLAYIDKVEIWDKAHYNSVMDEEPEDFSDLADEVLGGMIQIED